MTEIEKIAYAKVFIDKMAQGINPLDDTPIPDGDLVNNVRISRCLSFVSDVLRRICDRGAVREYRAPHPKEPFSVSPEVAESVIISDQPLPVSHFQRRIRSYAYENDMTPVSTNQIVNWLLSIDALTFVIRADGKRAKVPTDKGRDLGLIVERKNGRYGTYDLILYTPKVQRFIVDNIGEIAGNRALSPEQNHK